MRLRASIDGALGRRWEAVTVEIERRTGRKSPRDSQHGQAIARYYQEDSW